MRFHFFFMVSACLLLVLQSCTKTEIQFGTEQADPYIKITREDSVQVSISTFVMDSFSTTKPASFLVGSYRDAELGLVTTKPYLQLMNPSLPDITPDAKFDSITLIIRPNKVYYGDTTQSQTLEVRELSAPIEYTYSYYLYNTSHIAEKPAALGSRTLYIRPQTDDSISIRLSDSKGLELYNKIKTQASEVLDQDAFLNYFKGISIGYTGSNPSLSFGISDTVILRVHYHNTIPYPEGHTVDMKTYINGIYFNQVLPDRSGTLLGSLIAGGLKEIPSASTNGVAYSQGTTGLLMKLSFPGVRAALQTDTTIRLMAATLVIRPKAGTFDYYKMRLPASLLLVTTDASNTLGSQVYTPDGVVLYGYPVIDYLYKTPSYYAFDITNYINNIVRNTSTDDHALFVTENLAGGMTSISRGIFNSSTEPTQSAQLVLSILTVKK